MPPPYTMLETFQPRFVLTRRNVSLTLWSKFTKVTGTVAVSPLSAAAPTRKFLIRVSCAL